MKYNEINETLDIDMRRALATWHRRWVDQEGRFFKYPEGDIFWLSDMEQDDNLNSIKQNFYEDNGLIPKYMANQNPRTSTGRLNLKKTLMVREVNEYFKTVNFTEPTYSEIKSYILSNEYIQELTSDEFVEEICKNIFAELDDEIEFD